MTDSELYAIRMRDKARTPGKWYAIPHPEWDGASYRIGTNPDAPWANFGQIAYMGAADAAFTAHCSEDVPALLAEVDRLRGLLDEVPGRIRAWYAAGVVIGMRGGSPPKDLDKEIAAFIARVEAQSC